MRELPSTALLGPSAALQDASFDEASAPMARFMLEERTAAMSASSAELCRAAVGISGALSGFSQSLHFSGRIKVHALNFTPYVGPSAAQGIPVYLRLLHAVVADAIALGARWVSFGRTALEPKARLGAEPAALQCFVRHRIDPLNVIVRRLLELMPEPELPPERHPFKEADQAVR